MNGKPSDVWALISNPVELGKCIPGCEEVVVVSPTDSKWKVKVSAGVVSRRIDASAKILESVEPSELKVKVESTDGSVAAVFDVQLSEGGGSVTEMKFTAEIDAKGSFGWVVNQVVKSQLAKLVDEFARCVSSKATR